jgi:hypothetical protein
VSDTGRRQPHLVVPLGTRVVTRIEVRADSERAHRPVGSVAEVIGLPADEQAAASSALPEAPSAGPALHDLLVRVRLRGLSRAGGS